MAKAKKKNSRKPEPDVVELDDRRLELDPSGVQFDLYMIRATRRDTSEDEPTYVMARHEEEAVSLWHALNAADHEEACELTVTRIQNRGEAHER